MLILKTLHDFFRNWLNSLPDVCVFWLQKLRLDNVQLIFEWFRHISQKLYFKKSLTLYNFVHERWKSVRKCMFRYLIFFFMAIHRWQIMYWMEWNEIYTRWPKSFLGMLCVFAQWDSSNSLIDVYSHSGSNIQHLLPFFYLLYRRKRQYQYIIFSILLPTRCLAF